MEGLTFFPVGGSAPAISAAAPAQNSPTHLLALEEALLDQCESSDRGFLCFWESSTHFVVLGYGKSLAAEVHEEECGRLNIPILRRSSGGGTVLQGPGSFNYTLVLALESAPQLETITGANRLIMQRNLSALAPLTSGTMAIQGHTDLTLAGQKFSGNAQRRKRRCLLFHGSFLLGLDLNLVSRTLSLPEQQPEYRAKRPHEEFLANVKLDRSAIESALTRAWGATRIAEQSLATEVYSRAAALVESKYSRPEWNRRF